MNKLKKDEHEYIRLLKASFVLKVFMWFLSFFISLIIVFVFDSTLFLWVFIVLLNTIGMVLISITADLVAQFAESKKIQPNQWFIAGIEREKKHYGPLRANRLFGHPIGKKKWF